jgi:hypothetical protein
MMKSIEKTSDKKKNKLESTKQTHNECYTHYQIQ